MAFMQPEVVGKEDWAGVETTSGFWWVPFTVLTKAEAASARSGDFEPLLKYTEGGKVHNDMSSIKTGYGVRLSAPGYMDASEWEVYGSKKEALRRARELAREAEGEDHATKRAHATKKSPAQLQREINAVLAKPVTASKETSVLPPSVRVARAGLESVREHGIKNLRYGLYRHAGDRMYQWGNFTGTPEHVVTAIVPNAANTASQDALIRALKWKR